MQVLLTTLLVKLAVMAALATMLVRYRRFRHILIFERRAWRDRLTFSLALGIPLMLAVLARLLLQGARRIRVQHLFDQPGVGAALRPRRR